MQRFDFLPKLSTECADPAREVSSRLVLSVSNRGNGVLEGGIPRLASGFISSNLGQNVFFGLSKFRLDCRYTGVDNRCKVFSKRCLIRDYLFIRARQCVKLGLGVSTQSSYLLGYGIYGTRSGVNTGVNKRRKVCSTFGLISNYLFIGIG